MERGITGEFALVHAWKGDSRRQPGLPENGAELQPDDGDGRPDHDRGSRTVVEPGELDPDQIHTPAIFVQRNLSKRRPIESTSSAAR